MKDVKGYFHDKNGNIQEDFGPAELVKPKPGIHELLTLLADQDVCPLVKKEALALYDKANK